ncbi:MAG TPA: D-amino acid aminotransferase [Candidatus Macondimonas sp.]|nr:D-amino acid aminotransferase [Candidatus Macondimonas sp.]
MSDQPIVYLDGAFLPLQQARVSVLDRGFLFGDGVYEVIPVYAGRAFLLDEHLARLERSLDAIRLKNPLGRAAWSTMISTLIARQGPGDWSVYLQVTRGCDDHRDHAFPAEIRPTVFAMASPLKPPPAAWLTDGIATLSRPDPRWNRCDIKAIALLPNALSRQEAKDAGAVEIIYLRDGVLTEGAASNIFVVRDGVLLTSRADERILHGITRHLVLQLAGAAEITVCETDIPEEAVRSADELWMTSSTRAVIPITRLDGAPVGTGRPGPMHRRMMALWDAALARWRQGAALL